MCEFVDGQKCTTNVVIMEFKWCIQQNSSGKYVGCDKWHHSSNVV